MATNRKPEPICECELCKNKLPFDLPEEIIDATVTGNLVIFAGAGVSTETKTVFKNTLYEDVFEDLELNADLQIDFPDLMSKFCKQKNGRKLLLEKIRARFEYCHQFDELYRAATSFHKELSSIYLIQNIITTNWDDFFEKECNSIPIVTPGDFAFYNTSGRKVYKIHGSISNYGSIIATHEDYKRCYKELKSGIIGSTLKTILATKAVVFIGFSFRDFDFNKIYDYLKKELKDVIPHCYIITLDKTFNETFDAEKVTVINTDGTYFISILRKHLEGSKYLLPKKNLSSVVQLAYLRSMIHKTSEEMFMKNKTSTGIYNLFYQDGVQHAFDYLFYHSKTGLTFNPHSISRSIDAYQSIKKTLLKHKNYQDLAYVEGYISGLHSILIDDIEADFPFLFIMGIGPIFSVDEFKKLLKKQPIHHKAADSYAKKYMAGVLNPKADVVPHHRAFIF